MLDFDTATSQYGSLIEPPSLSEKTQTSSSQLQQTDSDDVSVASFDS